MKKLLPNKPETIVLPVAGQPKPDGTLKLYSRRQVASFLGVKTVQTASNYARALYDMKALPTDLVTDLYRYRVVKTGKRKGEIVPVLLNGALYSRERIRPYSPYGLWLFGAISNLLNSGFSYGKIAECLKDGTLDLSFQVFRDDYKTWGDRAVEKGRATWGEKLELQESALVY